MTELIYKPAAQQVHINERQHFEGIAPEVWEFKIGSYQVLDKWLKDCKKAKRSVSFDEILHYQRVVALKETMQIMIELISLFRVGLWCEVFWDRAIANFLTVQVHQ